MRPCPKPARLALRRVADAGRYGTVAVAPDGTVTGFVEKGAAGPGVVNGGIYRLDKAVLGRIPPHGACSLERDVFPGLAADGLIEGQAFDAAFLDIGVPEDLARAETVIRDVPVRHHSDGRD
jgi:D-glycero-D-manno-heptose 1,7-bisphosphate phosphatase